MQQSMLTLPCLFAIGVVLSLGRGNCQPSSLTPPAGFTFAGYWQCSGSFANNGRSHRSVYHGERSADGKWIDLTETDIEPKGYIGRYEIGTDAERDKVVFININSAGYAIFDSPGWDGKTLTVTSTDVLHYASATPKNRFLYTVHDAQHFDVEWQFEKANTWSPGDLLHCAAQTPRLAVDYKPVDDSELLKLQPPTAHGRTSAAMHQPVQVYGRFVRLSNSSSVRGQSRPSRRERLRSAST